MKEIQRMSITDSVVATIKDMILSGEYKENEKLPAEMSLCQSLKVSRTSVREALRVLQALGFVEMRPGKGAFRQACRQTLYKKADPGAERNP